jgi:hypothetical protein
MKKMNYLLLSLLLLGNFNLMAQNWAVGGNNLTAHGRLGTNTNYHIIFETKNNERGRLTNNGLWGFGTSNPSAKVHINSATGYDPLKVQVNNVLKLYVHTGGGVSIGSAATVIPPANGLLVAGSTGLGGNPGSYKVKITHGTFGFNIENGTTLDDWEFWTNSGGLSLYANGNFRGNFNPTTGAYTAVSDERFKTDIQAMPSVLKKVNELKPSTYQIKQENADARNKNNTPAYGFIAQDVMEIFPHLVTHHVDSERGIDAYTMDYSGFGVLAIKAIQELQQSVSTLENRIVQLETALEAVTKNNNPGHKGSTGVWLEKNFPNPFSQNTLIGYLAPAQAQEVDLIITNLQGVEIHRFDHLQAGQGKIEITAGSIPDGTYIYTLVVDGKAVAAQKMVLTR